MVGTRLIGREKIFRGLAGPPALSFFSTKSPHYKSTLTKTRLSLRPRRLRSRDKRQYTQQNSGYNMRSLTPSWLRNCRVHVVTLSPHTLCLLSLCLPCIRPLQHTVQLQLKNMWPVESLIALCEVEQYCLAILPPRQHALSPHTLCLLSPCLPYIPPLYCQHTVHLQ